jgi:glutathione S-transferase
MGEPDPAEVKKGEDKFHACAAVLDAQLKGRKYITGNTLTIADFSVGASLNQAQPAGLPVGQYREIVRWHAALSELPAWRKNRVEPPAN